jgi:hypothetical protein
LTIVLGTQFYEGPLGAMRRQQRALDALTALAGVEPLNIQWHDERYRRPGVETVAALKQDSRTLTGFKGGRKPILTELFDVLAAEAEARNRQYFGFFNADIIVTQAAVDTIRAGRKEAYAFSRMDVDESGHELSIATAGLDLFAFDATWWRENRRRFRPYILGERCFDNVFAAIMLCHGDGVILNRRGEIRHDAHPSSWQGPFDEYNVYLATLDAPYFTLWVAYWERLMAARARLASEAEEIAIQRDVFVLQRSIPSRVWHAGRCMKARWRLERQRRRRIRESA